MRERQTQIFAYFAFQRVLLSTRKYKRYMHIWPKMATPQFIYSSIIKSVSLHFLSLHEYDKCVHTKWNQMKSLIFSVWWNVENLYFTLMGRRAAPQPKTSLPQVKYISHMCVSKRKRIFKTHVALIKHRGLSF